MNWSVCVACMIHTTADCVHIDRCCAQFCGVLCSYHKSSHVHIQDWPILIHGLFTMVNQLKSFIDL